ncbi:MAG TPA: hypothetical protein VFO46_11960 [Candidatus Sulfotelmatobacter sp.]|nr:hypothetical protein [Candidatus Sulfotelmatobacter sp.]
MSQLKKQKPEAAESNGEVQTLRMENDDPVVGPDAPIANFMLNNLSIATARWNRPNFG